MNKNPSKNRIEVIVNESACRDLIYNVSMFSNKNLNRLGQLQADSAGLDPPANDRNLLASKVLKHVEGFLAQVDSRTFVEATPEIRKLSELPFPEGPQDADYALQLLKDHVDTVGVAVTSPNYFGYIPAGGLYHAALADFLAAAINRYAGWSSLSPGAARIEHKVVRWLGAVIGYSDTDTAKFGGTLTSGGSIATLIAIVVARDQRLLPSNCRKKPVLYKTQMTHHCIDKALHIAGLGHIEKQIIETDDNYRMSARGLEERIIADCQDKRRFPWLVVGTAGNVNTGSVDPLSDIARICREHNLWFHVDAAYGGLFRLCPESANVLNGIEASDSAVVDPHKGLFLPYGTGAVLVRDQSILTTSFHARGDYLEEEKQGAGEKENLDEPMQAHISPELTRPFRGLRLWLALQLAGVNAFRAALSEKLELARYFHSQLEQNADFEVIGEGPDLSIVTYRYRPAAIDDERIDQLNEDLVEKLKQNGEIFVTATKLSRCGSKRIFLRFAILSFRTHLEHVERALDVLTRTARSLKPRE